MRDFEYESPTTLTQALELMSSGQAVRPMAGGTDLIDHVRTGRLAPDLIIDVKKLPELNHLEITDAGLRLGAAVPCYRLYGDERIRKSYSALSDSAHIIGGMQIQSRASIGGNVCTSGPAADSIPSLIALSAVVVIAGPGGARREVPIEQFCTGPGKNVLQGGEIVVEFRMPVAANSGSHYRRFIPRNEMDIAVVGVGACVMLDDSKSQITAARIGVGAVAPTPLFAEEAGRLLVGRPADEAAYRDAAAAVVGIISPITDMRGTQEFRRHVTGVLVERVLAEAVLRARTH
ncbi:Nicotinate dehydrogenase FAD-subunit [Caulifigura coniformis]|uniref:Nicotinate dehydrogenase FAD-subunit n=1 Tax=Caulifigura coniformis TaxID=2527983 RepID=A0A517SBN3_9PLAN|nr:xanthine dehydrogenase family protein subunit M [Caulifigura coniformis]QDT53550.1 Nicotinate dehydrogenase FAD-subunit [Caulifigura coniformis]